MKASPLSYKNARPTLKDANDEIHPQSCRKGRDDTNAQPPERLNSFNDEMHAQLAECLKQVERDDTIRCLLLTGAGADFVLVRILTIVTLIPQAPHRI